MSGRVGRNARAEAPLTAGYLARLFAAGVVFAFVVLALVGGRGRSVGAVAGPSVSVVPATNLSDQQTVQVSYSGFSPTAAAVQIAQCLDSSSTLYTGVPSNDCIHNTSVLDSNISNGADSNISFVVTAVDNHGNPCNGTNTVCNITVYPDANDFTGAATQVISFNPSQVTTTSSTSTTTTSTSTTSTTTAPTTTTTGGTTTTQGGSTTTTSGGSTTTTSGSAGSTTSSTSSPSGGGSATTRPASVLGNQITGSGGGSSSLPLTGLPARIPVLLLTGILFTVVGAGARVALLHPSRSRSG